LPIISETYALSNTFNFKSYAELYEDNTSIFSIYLRSSNSINDENIKLSERIFLPSDKLRGFERGKVGPKDGNDFIGGNYAAAFNFSSTVPQILENSQNLDFLFFIDVANIWGVDYFKGDDEGSNIRSSVGIGLDWLTPIGPLNFTLSEALSKSSSDVTESFRFNLGTTF
jgi:outer membrane protein insertion porin family